MSEKNFSAGDLVRLKPKNSPEMVVESVGVYMSKTMVVATWFSGKKKETARFAPEALVYTSDDKD